MSKPKPTPTEALKFLALHLNICSLDDCIVCPQLKEAEKILINYIAFGEKIRAELLAVAEGCLGYLEYLPTGYRPDESWLTSLRIAIAKAKGEKP